MINHELTLDQTSEHLHDNRGGCAQESAQWSGFPQSLGNKLDENNLLANKQGTMTTTQEVRINLIWR